MFKLQAFGTLSINNALIDVHESWFEGNLYKDQTSLIFVRNFYVFPLPDGSRLIQNGDCIKCLFLITFKMLTNFLTKQTYNSGLSTGCTTGIHLALFPWFKVLSN